MTSNQLNPTGKRLRTVILAFPLLVATSYVLYQRMYESKEQRKVRGPGDNPFRETMGNRG
ncbi:hypothetical protein EMMF5_005541 [Cystobasidiomycetes sp. EMM_F5]